MGKGKNLKQNCASEVTIARGDTRRRNLTTSGCCRSFLSCCFKRNRRQIISKQFTEDIDTPEYYDYIVEKLVIKRVPISLFAMSHDTYGKEKEPEDCDCERNKSPKVSQSTKNIYSIAPATNSSVFYADENNEPGPSGFMNGAKILRFSPNDNDRLKSYNEKPIIHENAIQLLDRFTALHPNLKESERAPKDPCPLNTVTKSRRLLAEEISEISSTTKIETPNVSNINRDRLTNQSSNKGNSKLKDSVALSPAPQNPEIPTRDQLETAETPNRTKNETTSCFPFGRRYFEAARVEIDETDTSLSFAEKSPSGKENTSTKNTNFTIAPVQIHCNSPNLLNLQKIIEECSHSVDKPSANRSNLIDNKLSETPRIESPKKSETGEPSGIANDQKNDNLSGTTLRWKIIIKHHPPDNSKKVDKKEQIGFTTLPAPNKSPPHPVVDGVQTHSLGNSKIDRNLRHKRKK